MRFRVIALDPGGTTGWASYTAQRMYDINTDRYSWWSEVWSSGQLGPDEHHNKLDVLLGNQQVEEYHVVSESFEFRNTQQKDRNAVNLISREYIGVAKRFCQERGLEYKQYPPGVTKPFVSNAVLKNLGLWAPGMSGEFRHAADAGRVLVFDLVNRHKLAHIIAKGFPNR